MFEKKKKRFESVSSQGLGFNAIDVIVDNETGVHYIVLQGGSGGSSITPLLDEKGNVFISKQY